jgi:hypothetical protein
VIPIFPQKGRKTGLLYTYFTLENDPKKPNPIAAIPYPIKDTADHLAENLAIFHAKKV